MIDTLIQCVDLTSLSETDTSDSIKALCKQALTLPHVAAVCCFPQFVSCAKAALGDSSIKVATVVNFPSGISSTEMVLADTVHAVMLGADEIDCVIPYRSLGQPSAAELIQEFVAAVKVACQGRTLKVILETGALTNEQIQLAARASIAGGADFLKTSTGKIETGATEQAVKSLLETCESEGSQTGIKVSGGIRTVDQALLYSKLIQQFRGKSGLNPAQFRIGASALLCALRSKLQATVQT